MSAHPFHRRFVLRALSGRYAAIPRISGHEGDLGAPAVLPLVLASVDFGDHVGRAVLLRQETRYVLYQEELVPLIPSDILS
jgi:hypothetical protein